MSIGIALLVVAQAAASAPCAPGTPPVSEEWLKACEAAIAAASGNEKAELLYRKAYSLNGAGRPAEAIPVLDEAVQLDPDLAAAYHERAYSHSDLGHFAQALADLDRELALVPGSPGALEERGYVRFRMGDLAGSYDDFSARLKVSPDDPNALVWHAEAAMWLGRMDEARADLDRGQQFARLDQKPNLYERTARRLALWTKQSGAANPAAACLAAKDDAVFRTPEFVGDCSAGFLAAKTDSERAELLTQRSIAWPLLGDRDASTADKQLAMALDPDRADWTGNLALDYLSTGRADIAMPLFDRALSLVRADEKPRSKSFFLAGRASARYALQDYAGAFADLQQSFKIEPNELGLLVAGDLALHQNKDAKGAREFWMAAYRLGARGDHLRARLKLVGVTDPDEESQ
jgi:tetratricopeptide (TPR) repeat protein